MSTGNIRSRAEQLLENRENSPPLASPNMAKNVSQYRKQVMDGEFGNGQYREHGIDPGVPGTSKRGSYWDQVSSDMGVSPAGYLTHNGKLYKSAQAALGGGVAQSTSGVANSPGVSFRGAGGTVRQMPEVYSPLWLHSNLNLPRDRATINAWCRAYFALNPIVHNAISLHSTYPIAKLNIKCKDPKIEAFFAQMIEELDLMNICVQLAQEYWILGEAFVYGELDESTAKWSRLLIQNPDYITVKRSVIAGEPIISLRPDENLKRLVSSPRPSDIQQRSQLDPAIVEHVRKGQNIPLNNFYVSHLARKISPYEIRGTGLIVSCFRQLMLFDQFREAKYTQASSMVNPLTLIKIGSPEFRPTPVDLEQWRNVFECHDEETEVLTDQGFRKFNDVIEYSEAIDGTYNLPYITYARPKQNIKIACFNQITEALEYHEPSAAHVYNYNGEMYHFKARNMDIKVTPNHDMWIKKARRLKDKPTYSDWHKIEAKDISPSTLYRTRATCNWKGKELKHVKVLGKKVPIELYLKFLGYLISEGCLESKNYYALTFTQSVDSDCINDIINTVNDFAKILGKNACERIREIDDPEIYKEKPSDVWASTILSRELVEYFIPLCTHGDGHTAEFKCIPSFVFDLSPKLLKILLKALVNGDGSDLENKCSDGFKYYTSSPKLANDIQELVFKCGFSSNSYMRNRTVKSKSKYAAPGETRNSTEYIIHWSTAADGTYPATYKRINKVPYNGKVWCFTVPTGLFITRRNGKITIQGNSAEHDKNFKIFTHDAVNVERIGFAQGIYDISGDITQLIKEIYIGLMVPSVIMDGSDTTYATGSVALDVLRQRYVQFRNMLAAWLRSKIFAPISKLNEFYERKDGKKHLIVPEVEWNRMSLFDTSDYIQTLSALTQGGPDKKVSLQTLYRSLGLEYEDEMRKLRYEDIQDAIRRKEIESLNMYSLNELRAMSPTDEIEEPSEPPLPGEVGPQVEPPVGGQMGGGGGMGGLGLPPPPGGPPPAPIGGGGDSTVGIGPGGAPLPPPPA